MNTFPRRSGARTRSVPARAAGSLVALALAASLAACGSDDTTATDPAGSTGSPSETTTPSESPSQTPTESPSDSASAPASPSTIEATGSAGVTEATLLSATEGGGSPSPLAFVLDGDQAVSDFVVGLQQGLAEQVTAAVADVSAQAADATTYGAVVATGCDAPTSVAIDAGEAGLEVTPTLPKSTVQCLAPVTFVVVFSAPDA